MVESFDQHRSALLVELVESAFRQGFRICSGICSQLSTGVILFLNIFRASLSNFFENVLLKPERRRVLGRT